ncbi:MAG: type II toxin-antitoxin system RelB/DinJ family antitoxin [Clostridiales Family XIII bacterium]|jgi:DNA-damage-inducible protein J|nr:type II toxin-antitoxin system RelB/DinJ family antitoxin [Clostridiales Family XIII bacterium]
MATVQIATRIDEEQSRRFRTITKALGTTPADALRMFVASFNAEGGFPFETKIKMYSVEAFDNESEATDFATRVSMRSIHEAR